LRSSAPARSAASTILLRISEERDGGGNTFVKLREGARDRAIYLTVIDLAVMSSAPNADGSASAGRDVPPDNDESPTKARKIEREGRADGCSPGSILALRGWNQVSLDRDWTHPRVRRDPPRVSGPRSIASLRPLAARRGGSGNGNGCGAHTQRVRLNDRVVGCPIATRAVARQLFHPRARRGVTFPHDDEEARRVASRTRSDDGTRIGAMRRSVVAARPRLAADPRRSGLRDDRSTRTPASHPC